MELLWWCNKLFYLYGTPSLRQIDFESLHFQVLERFTVDLYDKAVMCNTWMKQEERCFVKIKYWRDFPLPGMHFCSTQSEQHIKLEYGHKYQPVSTNFLDSREWNPWIFNDFPGFSKKNSLILIIIYYFSRYNQYKHASLACAARLADTLCPHESPFGRLVYLV